MGVQTYSHHCICSWLCCKTNYDDNCSKHNKLQHQ